MIVSTIILTNKATSVIKIGKEMWKKLLPLNALGNRWINSPLVFTTDESTAIKNAMQECFPQATLILCILHVLWAVIVI